MGTFLILMVIMGNTAKKYHHVQTVVSMIEVETQLINYFQNYEVLKAYSSELRLGTFTPKALVLDGRVIGRVGAPLFIDQEGKECKSTADPICRLKIEVGVKCLSRGAGADCRAAYRINSLVDSVVPLGVAHQGDFTDADYTLPISYELSMRSESDSCSSVDEMFAAGMNRETGKMWCLKRPQTSCAQGQVAKGLRFNAATASLEPVCRDSQVLRCPTNYVLNSFRISSLESGQPKEGECVFVTKKEVPWRKAPEPAASVSGTFCPKYYKTKASCSVTVTSQWPGACPYSCNCTEEGCDTCYTTTSPSNVGNYTLVQGVDQTASCAINPGTQSCGAGWTGVARLTGACVLTEPEKAGLL